MTIAPTHVPRRARAAKIASLLICFLFTGAVSAQTPPPELQGAELRTWLAENYYEGTHRALQYKNARRAMYHFIDNYRNAIVGVYGGYVRPLRFDPAGRESNPGPINAEHTVPQSLFDKREPMRSDLHHIFPTYIRWNSTRQNYPFREIPDHETTKWMVDDEHQIFPPPLNQRSSYSEYASRSFEPRHAHKGNVAKAVFYFFTMYPDFDISRLGDINTLYAWHLADGVDDRERERNDRIAERQGNRNPFIDHEDWILRAWPRVRLAAVADVLKAMGEDSARVEAAVGHGVSAKAMDELN